MTILDHTHAIGQEAAGYGAPPADVVRLYPPPDADTLPSVAEHRLCGRDLVNVIAAGENPSPDRLSPEETAPHRARGLGIWDRAEHGEDLPEIRERTWTS